MLEIFAYHTVVHFTGQNWISKTVHCIPWSQRRAIYKNRSTGTGNGMLGTRGMGGMLYSGECRQTFRGTSPNVPGNVLKHSGECPQTIQIILENNLWHVVKHPVESMKAFGWMYIIALDTGDHELYLLLLNSRKRKRASLSFLTKSKNILN